MNTDESINYDNKIYISILLLSISSFIIFLIYFISIISYIRQNYRTKKITLLWINYSIINFTVILFLFLYILKLISEKKERDINPDELSSNFFSVIIYICIIFLIYSIINGLIFDFIKIFETYHKIKKLSKLKVKEAKYLELNLKEIKLQNIFNQNTFFTTFIIFNIIHIGFLILYIFAYLDTNINRTKGFFTINSLFTYLLKNYYFLVLILVLIYMLLLKRAKKMLDNCEYYNKNLFEQKMFNIYSNRAKHYTYILNYQFIVQLFLNIPIILFLLIKSFNILSFVIFIVSMYAYVFLGGVLYLNMDENNNAADCPNLVRKLFCFNDKTIFFRNKNIKDIFNDFIYHYDNNEKTKITDLEVTLFKRYSTEKRNNPQNNMYPLQTNDDKIFTSSRKLFNFDPNLINRNIILDKRNNSDFPKIIAKTVIDFTSLCDYYILYKLLYLYFQENRDVYDNVFRKMSDDAGIFRKMIAESNPFRRKSSLGVNNSISNNNLGYNINKQDLITNIERISRISIIDSKKIKTSLKVSSSDIFLSVEEKDLLDEFKLKYGFKSSDIDFKIESMFAESFFEVIPYFQLKIDDIIKALMPSYNKKLFNIFIKKISPYKNKIEQNIFMSYDSLIIIEVYEKKDFINSENLKKFVNQYKTYLTNTLKNMDYTYLPLVIGIFNIQIGSLTKIAVMYRNPLHFTLYNHFNNWITFYINESTEKLKASLMLDDVIDLNEIEVKNALKINEADYEEVKKNFKQDLTLLKEINVPIYPVVRLFIGDENGAIKPHDSNYLGFNKNYKITNINEPSILDESTHNKQQNISELLEMSDIINLSLTKKISSDYFENDINSILEKEYYSMSGNDIHTIKIYFTNLFRTGNELSRKKRDFLNDNKEDVSLTYRNFIEEELFNYLTKASSFLEDNEKKEKENNDIDIIIKKRMNLIEKDMIEDEKNSSESSDTEEFKRKNSNKKENKNNDDKKNEDIKNEENNGEEGNNL